MVCTDPECLPLFPRSLHARTLRILRSCLQCPAVPELCMPMLVQPGWGCGLTETPQMLRGLGIGAAAATAATAVKEGEDDDDEKEGEGDGGVKRGEDGGLVRGVVAVDIERVVGLGEPEPLIEDDNHDPK